MNRSQFAVLVIAAGLAVLAVIYRPYYVDGLIGGIVYRLPRDQPEDSSYSPGRLHVEFSLIALFAIASLFAAREGGGRLDRFVLRSLLVVHASLLYYFIPQLDCIFADALMLGGSLLASVASIAVLVIARLTRAVATSACAVKLHRYWELNNE